MPIEQKSQRDTREDPLGELPEIPQLETLSIEERAKLDTWWLQVREVLSRFSDLVSPQ